MVNEFTEMETFSRRKLPPIPSNIFFAGAAWGAGFHIGVYKALQEMYGLEALTQVTFAGNSTGAMIALSAASAMGWQAAEKMLVSLIKDGVENGPFQKSSMYHDKAMDAVLLKDPDLYRALNNRLFIGVTTWFNDYQLISKWNNNDELRECMHASMHIPYYTTHLSEIKCNDGKYRRAIEGAFSKQFVRFDEDTLVITAVVEDVFNPERGDICSEPVLSFLDCLGPDLATYSKIRDNGYQMMMEWDGKYKVSQKSKSSVFEMMKVRFMREIKRLIVFCCWCLRMLEEIRVKRMLIFILLVMLYRYRKYRSMIWPYAWREIMLMIRG